MPCRKQTSLPSVLFAAALVTAGGAHAQTDREGYSQYGAAHVIRDGFGGCVRTGLWSSDKTIPECGATLKKAPRPAAAEARVPPPPPAPQEPATPPPPIEPAQVKPLAEPSAPERSPVPVAVPPAPAAAPEITSFGAEMLFDLNKADIRPRGKAKLDELAVRIRSKPVRNIEVNGHSDRSGPAKLNQRLSLKRALAVKQYLVSKGIPGASITATGKGSSIPVTTPGECDGVRRRQLAACLQPDRRVEVSVER